MSTNHDFKTGDYKVYDNSQCFEVTAKVMQPPETRKLFVCNDMTIYDFKAHNYTDFRDHVSFSIGTNELRNDRTVKDYNITSDTVIFVTIRSYD